MTYQDHKDRIIYALSHNISLLTPRDRLFITDFLETFLDCSQRKHIVKMIDYQYYEEEAAE